MVTFKKYPKIVLPMVNFAFFAKTKKFTITVIAFGDLKTVRGLKEISADLW